MKKKLISCVALVSMTFIVGIFSVGCGAEADSDASRISASADGEITKNTGYVSDESAIVWAIPDYIVEAGQKLDKLNEKLVADGYPYTIEFMTINSDSYNRSLCRVLEEGTADIAFLGMESAGYVDISVTDVIREGNVEELSSYLQSDQGKELYEAYPEKLWDAALVDGAQYFLPSEYMGYGMMYYVFNKTYFTESDVEQFDGSLESLVSLAKENVPESVSYPIFWDCNTDTIANWCGYQNHNYAFTSLDTGEACNPLESGEVRQFILQCQDAADKGILRTLESEDETLLDIERSGNFGVIACTAGDISVNETTEDVLLVRAPYALFSSTSAGTGICANSEKKEEALELLTLLHTDPEYANLLIWGEEDTDYRLVDGYGYDLDGNVPAKYMSEAVLGVYDLVYPTENSHFPVETKAQKEAFLDSDSLKDNVLVGFIPEFKDEEMDYAGLMELLYFCMTPSVTGYSNMDLGLTLNKTDYENPEEWLNKAVEYYELMGGNEVVSELNRQIGEWMK